MPGPKGTERGDRSPFRMRAGIDLDQLLGKVTERDPGALPLGAHQELINVELTGAGWGSRDGLQKSNDTGLDANCCIEMIHELSDVGAPVESAFGGGIVLLEDEEDGGDPSKVRIFSDLNTPDKLMTYTVSDVPATGIAYRSVVFSQNAQAIIAGSGADASFVSRLCRITMSDPPTMVSETSIAGVGGSNETGITGLAADGAGTPTVVHAAVGTPTGAANMRIASWNPETAETAPTIIDSAMGAPGGEIILGYFEDELVAAWSTGNANRIRIGNGITAGVDEAMPGTLFHGKCMVMYDELLYILGNKSGAGMQAITYDGASLAIAFTAIPVAAVIERAVVLDNLLVFVWTESPEVTWLGTWDGTTLLKSVFNLSSLPGVMFGCSGLYSYNGRIVVVLNGSVGGTRLIFQSDGSDLTTWTKEGATIVGPIDIGVSVGDDIGQNQQLVIACGKQYLRTSGSRDFGPEVPLPDGVRLRAARPWPIDVRRGSFIETIVVGRYSPGVIWVRGTSYLLGIAGPTAAPTLATNSTGLTGTTIGYISFVHKVTYRGQQVVIHESNLSSGSATLTLSNQGIRWTLPTTHSNARVTHVRMYRTPIDGGILPRFIADVALGTTTYDEAFTDAQIQEQITPAIVRDSNGEYDVDPAARGIPPYCQIAASYNYRAWYARDPKYPARLWRSRQNEPESVNLTNGYDETPDGKAITALGATENELLVFTATGAFAVEDYGGTDIKWRRLVPSAGCVAPYSVRNIRGMLVFMSGDGPTVYPTWRNLIHKSRRSEFEAKYLANPKAYQAAFGFNHSQKGVYELLLNYDVAPKSRSWCWAYHPLIAEGKEPDWYWYDRILDRRVYTIGELYDPDLMKPVAHYGSCDGFLRTDDASNGDDDGDTYGKAMTITTRHELMGDQAGDDEHGRSFGPLDLMLQNEVTDVTVRTYCGDETAIDAANPSETIVIKAGEETRAGRTAVPRTSLQRTLDTSTGKGITVKITATAPIGVQYRGLSIHYGPGGQSRPLT